MLTTHAVGSATAPLIVYCSFVFRVVDFIIDDFFLKKKGLIYGILLKANVSFLLYIFHADQA